MPSNTPVWLPGVLFVVVFLGAGVLISLHPRFRNRYRPSPRAPGQPTLFQKWPRGPGVMSMDVVGGLLHFKSAGAWPGVVRDLHSQGVAHLPLRVRAAPGWWGRWSSPA